MSRFLQFFIFLLLLVSAPTEGQSSAHYFIMVTQLSVQNAGDLGGPPGLDYGRVIPSIQFINSSSGEALGKSVSVLGDGEGYWDLLDGETGSFASEPIEVGNSVRDGVFQFQFQLEEAWEPWDERGWKEDPDKRNSETYGPIQVRLEFNGDRERTIRRKLEPRSGDDSFFGVVEVEFALFYTADPTSNPPSRYDDFSWDLQPKHGFYGDSLAQERFERLESRAKREDEIRVLSWNLHEGDTDRAQAPLYGFSPAEKNLRAIVNHPTLSPDLIVIPEYLEFHPAHYLFTSEFIDELKQAYPYGPVFVPYNREKYPRYGIAVFSKLELSLESRDQQGRWQTLDWVPQEGADAYRAKWLERGWKTVNFTRPYVQFSVQVGGQRVHFVTTHLLEPWAMTKEAEGSLETFLEMAGYDFDAYIEVEDMRVGLSPAAKNNPLYHQVTRLKERMRESFGDEYSNSPLVLVGDFNVPNRLPALNWVTGRDDLGWPLMTWTPLTYQELSQGLHPIVFNGVGKTFPTQSSRVFFYGGEANLPDTQIDHAFTSDQVEVTVSDIFLWSGSDHGALYFGIRPLSTEYSERDPISPISKLNPR